MQTAEIGRLAVLPLFAFVLEQHKMDFLGPLYPVLATLGAAVLLRTIFKSPSAHPPGCGRFSALTS